jgi:hypothetical protein
MSSARILQTAHETGDRDSEESREAKRRRGEGHTHTPDAERQTRCSYHAISDSKGLNAAMR